MEVIIQAWQWVPWLMGFGAVGWIALAIFAPSVLLIVTPLLQGMAQGLVEFIKVLYAGLTNILNSWQSMVAVLVIALVATNYGTYKEKHKQDVAPLIQEAPVAKNSIRPTHSKKPAGIVVPQLPSPSIFNRSSAPVLPPFQYGETR